MCTFLSLYKINDKYLMIVTNEDITKTLDNLCSIMNFQESIDSELYHKLISFFRVQCIPNQIFYGDFIVVRCAMRDDR